MRSCYEEEVLGLFLLAAKGTWTFKDFLNALARFHTHIEFKLDATLVPAEYAAFLPDRCLYVPESALKLPCSELLAFTRFDDEKDSLLAYGRRIDESTPLQRSAYGERIYRTITRAISTAQQRFSRPTAAEYLDVMAKAGLRICPQRNADGRVVNARLFDVSTAGTIVRTVAAAAIGLERDVLDLILGEHLMHARFEGSSGGTALKNGALGNQHVGG